jgi:hypothetical protein
VIEHMLANAARAGGIPGTAQSENDNISALRRP